MLVGLVLIASLLDFFFNLKRRDGLVVDHWCCYRGVRLRNRFHVLVSFSQALFLITKSLEEDLKP